MERHELHWSADPAYPHTRKHNCSPSSIVHQGNVRCVLHRGFRCTSIAWLFLHQHSHDCRTLRHYMFRPQLSLLRSRVRLTMLLRELHNYCHPPRGGLLVRLFRSSDRILRRKRHPLRLVPRRRHYHPQHSHYLRVRGTPDDRRAKLPVHRLLQ